MGGYIYCRPLSEAEKEVQGKGFTYVHTTWLHLLDNNGSLILRAQEGPSILKVLFGKLSVVNWHQGCTEPQSRGQDVSCKTLIAGDEMELMECYCYTLDAEANGCLFVEGHEYLSPANAERFEDEGTMKLIGNGKEDKARRLRRGSEDASTRRLKKNSSRRRGYIGALAILETL